MIRHIGGRSLEWWQGVARTKSGGSDRVWRGYGCGTSHDHDSTAIYEGLGWRNLDAPWTIPVPSLQPILVHVVQSYHTIEGLPEVS